SPFRARRADSERGCRYCYTGHRKQWTERAARRHEVSDTSTGPRPEGDGAQRNPDDQGARLERETEVWSEQPERHDLDDEYTCRRTEDQCCRRVPTQFRPLRKLDDDLARPAASDLWRSRWRVRLTSHARATARGG